MPGAISADAVFVVRVLLPSVPPWWPSVHTQAHASCIASCAAEAIGVGGVQAKNLDQLLGFSSPMDHTKYDRYGALQKKSSVCAGCHH